MADYILKHTGPQIDALLTKTEGLHNYDDTEIRNDILELQQTKVTAIEGKGLSTNDFTDTDKQDLDNVVFEVHAARGKYSTLGARLNAMSGGGGGGTTDYEELENLPTINGHTVIGNLTTEDLGISTVQADWSQTDPTAIDFIKNKPDITEFQYKTTAQWNAEPDLIAQANQIYVYTDYQTIGGQPVPGFKVGDGTSRLIDLPFTGSSGSVSDAEKTSWNNKVTASINPEDEENLIFSND